MCSVNPLQKLASIDTLHIREGLLTHLTETARDLLVHASILPPTASFLDTSCESVNTLHICEGLRMHLTETTNLVDTLHICVAHL